MYQVNGWSHTRDENSNQNGFSICDEFSVQRERKKKQQQQQQ